MNPNQIVASGDSGGGGPSWDLALTQDQVVQLASTPSSVVTAQWVSPLGTPLHLAAAVPMFTWTDLIDALVSNGRASDCVSSIPATCSFGEPTDASRTSPIGVEKESYVAGLFVKGPGDVPSDPQYGAQYVAAPNSDPTADLTQWFADINLGEPTFGANPNTPSILAQIGGQLRSPFAIDVPPPAHRVPIFVIQGDTDPLFPALQALTEINKLKSASADYPVWGFLGDVGHSYAQNPLPAWIQAHQESNDFVSAAVNAAAAGTLSQFSTSQFSSTYRPLTVVTDTCAGQTAASYTGNTIGDIPAATMTFSGGAGTTVTTGSDLEGAMLDPIANSGCPAVTAGTPSDSSQAIYTFPVASTFTMVGGPVVNATASLSGASAELAARLYDVDPSGKSWLVGRTVVRLDEGASPTTANALGPFELWPNAWQFCSGHSIKLELTQVDSPTWRLDNEPSSMSLSGMQLSLPVIPRTSCTTLGSALPESPIVPILPAIALPVALGVLALRRHRRRMTVRV